MARQTMLSKDTHIKAQRIFEDYWEMHRTGWKLREALSALAVESGHTVEEIRKGLLAPEPTK